MKHLLTYRIDWLDLQDNGFYKSFGNLTCLGGIYRAVSGGGNTKGTIPLGLYDIKFVSALSDTDNNAPYKKEGFPWIARLAPLGYCERTGLAIHPDGNVPGTAGCLGILNKDIELYNVSKSIVKDGARLLVI